MTTLMQASHQWASRPADQRFLDLHELRARTEQGKLNSTGKVVPTKALHFEPMDDHKGLKIAGQNGVAADITHWSFGQLAGLAKAPAGYLRELPEVQQVADQRDQGDARGRGRAAHRNGVGRGDGRHGLRQDHPVSGRPRGC